jgi:hypothetical protein
VGGRRGHQDPIIDRNDGGLSSNDLLPRIRLIGLSQAVTPDRLADARRDVEELRRRWTAAAAEMQELTTLLAAAVGRVSDLIAETESGDARRERRGELNKTARAVRVPTSPWLSPLEAAERSRCHRSVIYDALWLHQEKPGSGLKGRQRTAPHGSWLIHIDDLDAWAAGEPMPDRRRKT